jgi:hypothetical protein
MKGNKRIMAMMVIAMVVSGSITVLAYNSFTAERTAAVNVVDDTQGIIALNPGGSSFVTLVDGEMEIDVTNGGAQGVNVNSTLTIGDSESPSTSYAYSFTNNDNQARDVTFEYNNVASDSASSDNMNFLVYDGSGAKVGEFNETSSYTVTGMGSGATHYVVLEVDTTTSQTSDDLSGTIRITSS